MSLIELLCYQELVRFNVLRGYITEEEANDRLAALRIEWEFLEDNPNNKEHE